MRNALRANCPGSRSARYCCRAEEIFLRYICASACLDRPAASAAASASKTPMMLFSPPTISIQ